MLLIHVISREPGNWTAVGGRQECLEQYHTCIKSGKGGVPKFALWTVTLQLNLIRGKLSFYWSSECHSNDGKS